MALRNVSVKSLAVIWLALNLGALEFGSYDNIAVDEARLGGLFVYRPYKRTSSKGGC